jgi:hypothetical protein
MNCFTIESRSCHLGFKDETSIPRSQLVIFREVNIKVQGTSSTFAFLNHFFPTARKPVAWLKNSFVTSNCTSPIYALQQSKVKEKSWATQILKHLNFSMNTCHLFLSKLSLALSYDTKVWMPLGSILITGDMANRRESTQHSQVGFDKNPQSHIPEPQQNNAMTFQMVGRGINHHVWEQKCEARDHT